jgi:hypothetical protein
MIRRLRSAAETLLQGAYGVTVEILALAALFGFAALVAFLVTLIP